ncbi:hypothetical protein IF2G_08458 [Cordyceps javanica]|nr:hypothetical protein IF2G_08458 [Cordyceps javanica]
MEMAAAPRISPKAATQRTNKEGGGQYLLGYDVESGLTSCVLRLAKATILCISLLILGPTLMRNKVQGTRFITKGEKGDSDVC